jgi:RimJ/RimL family protein N-acetyltransferase
MERDDIEIGPTWTVPDFRGRGLAVFAIRKVLELWAKDGRKFWYVTRESNAASRRAAEKAGLIAVASGRRIKKMGLLAVMVPRR